jgi:DNA-binding XRE family transcriptional regulator
MGIVVKFPRRRRHARDSLGRRAAAKLASTSSVISLRPRSEAKRTSAAQCGDGMPPGRDFQLLTVDRDSPSASATAPVFPSASMISSAVDAISTNIVRTVRTCQEFATSETTNSHRYAVMEPTMDSTDIIARRLIALRLELGFKTQEKFAEELEMTKSTYNPFETGKRALTFEAACKIRRRFGVPVDWLFFGDMPKISDGVLLQLGPEPKKPVRTKRTASGK